MLSITPHEYFNHLNLMAFDSGSAQYIKDEIQSFENIDVLNGSDVMDELNDLIALNFAPALKDIEKPAPFTKAELNGAISQLERIANKIECIYKKLRDEDYNRLTA